MLMIDDVVDVDLIHSVVRSACFRRCCRKLSMETRFLLCGFSVAAFFTNQFAQNQKRPETIGTQFKRAVNGYSANDISLNACLVDGLCCCAMFVCLAGLVADLLKCVPHYIRWFESLSSLPQLFFHFSVLVFVCSC